MNRALTIPAASCLIVFVIAFAALHDSLNSAAADNRPTDVNAKRVVNPESSLTSIPLPGTKLRPAGSPANPLTPMSNDEAREALTKLTEKYTQPWHEWENSPTRLYSRAAPRQVPAISTSVTVTTPDDPRDGFFLATIEVKIGRDAQPAACMIDRTSKRVFVFKDGAWIAGDKWAEAGPLPK
jgi:hypothetical protein